MSVLQRDTHKEILDTATVLMQDRGYHAFSYADIAERVGIRKASIHYYYPSKSDLAQSVVARYRSGSKEAIAWLNASFTNPIQILEHYIFFYEEEFEGNPRICLCALLAAEMSTLPENVRAEVQAFYQEHEAWLSSVLETGRQEGSLQFQGSAADTAAVLLATLEGAMLAARAYKSVDRLRAIGQSLLRQYTPAI